MKTIELQTVSPAVVELLDQARGEDVIVRLADGSEFLLSAVEDFEREVVSARRNKKLMAFLEARAGNPSAGVELEEVKRRLGL